MTGLMELSGRDGDVAHLRDQLGAAMSEVTARRTRTKWIALAVGGALAAAIFAVPPIGLIGAVVAGVVYFREKRRLVRQGMELDVARELLAGVADDLLPGRKVKLTLDLRPFDLRTFLVSERFTGRRTVSKYRKNWLSLAIVLADGTEVQIRQRGHWKQKKGNAGEKRHALLAVRPNPRRYDVARIVEDAETLEKRLRGSLRQLFHDPPEAFHARAETTGGALVIRVRQDDAPILARELLALLFELVRFLEVHRR